MQINENKYHSTIKMEFRDLIDNIVHSDRRSFHMYTIHRLLSLGLLIDFPYEYVKTHNPELFVGLELSLKEHGKVTFLVNIDTDTGSVADEECLETLKEFLQNFNTHVEVDTKQKRRKLF